jgi:hypothetical protein
MTIKIVIGETDIDTNIDTAIKISKTPQARGRKKDFKADSESLNTKYRFKKNDDFTVSFLPSAIPYEFEEKNGVVLGGNKKPVLVLAANVGTLNTNLSATLPTPTFRNSLRDQHDSEGNITATKNTYADIIIVQDEYSGTTPTGNKIVWHKANVPSKAGADDLTRIESIALDALIP